MAIKCRDFDRLWNELLDAAAAVSTDRERALLDHAAGCPTCRQVAERYQGLRRALRAWGPPPMAPAGLTDRILAAVRTQALPSEPWSAAIDRASRYSRWGLTAALAATVAAAITVYLLVGLTIHRSRLEHAGPSVTRRPGGVPDPVTVADPRPLHEALASATAATWELARSASEPAARISREVIDVATGSELSPDQTASDAGADTDVVMVSVPRLGSLAPDSDAAVAMLQQVGDRLATGVRPLSSTARRAFGFLLGPSPSKPDARTNPPAEKGA
jgi:hypothetical protein